MNIKDTIKGKRLLILGGIALSNEIINYAKKMGATAYITDYLEDSPAKKNADKSFMTSTTEVNAVSELIQQENIDGVLTGFVDLLLPYYADICKKNDLFSYGTKEQFNLLHDKEAFKALCRKFEIPVVEEYHIKNRNDTNEIEALPYPLLLKPADNSGGRGITICPSAKEFNTCYNKTLGFSKSKTVVVERYMQAEEATIFYMLHEGEIKLSAMGNRHIQHFKEGLIPLPVAYSFPSQYVNEFEQTLNEKVIAMFKSIGLKNGMVFIQTFVENGKCIFYEMGYRLTGSLEYKIIEHASRYNPMEVMIQQALTGNIESPIMPKVNPHFKYKYCNITFLVKPGVIGKIEGVEEIKELEGVLDFFLSYKTGDEITTHQEGTLAQVVARAFAYAVSFKELAKIMQAVYTKFKVYSIEGENMLLPNFNLNNLPLDKGEESE